MLRVTHRADRVRQPTARAVGVHVHLLPLDRIASHSHVRSRAIFAFRISISQLSPIRTECYLYPGLHARSNAAGSSATTFDSLNGPGPLYQIVLKNAHAHARPSAVF